MQTMLNEISAEEKEQKTGWREEAGLLRAVQAAGLGFQYKNGFAFSWGDEYTSFSFLDKFGTGNETAFNVPRAAFDKLLIDEVEKQGVAVRFGESLKAFDNEGNAASTARAYRSRSRISA